MANPTTAKPTTAELLSSDPMFAAIKAKVPLVATATGLHREVVANKAGRPLRWVNAADTMMPYGPAPTVNPTGFAPQGTNLGPSLVFGHSRQSLRFVGSGYAGGRPSVFSAFAVFKPVAPTGSLNGRWDCWAVTSAIDSGAFGVGYSVAATGGVLTLAAVRSQALVSSALALANGHWYAAWAELDDSGATKFVDFWLYDFTSQTLLSASGGVGTQVSAGSSNAFASTTADLAVGSLAYSGATMPFLGEIADAGLYAGAGTDALFTGYLTDPWSLVRGSYTPSGVLAAGEAWAHDATTTQLLIGATRCTGTGTGGTGAPTYQWYGSQASNFTPGAGNLIAGATALNLTWTPPTPGIWWLKLVATDGSSSVTYQQIGIANFPKPDLALLSIGDSIRWLADFNGTTTNMMACVLYASGRRVIVHSRGVTGSHAGPTSWGTSGTILASAVADAVADGITDAEIMLGANDTSSGANQAPATYQANLQNIINYLSTNNFRRIWLHYPTFYQQPGGGFDAANAFLVQYQPAIDALVAANPGLCYAGDQANCRTTLADAYQFAGPHPGFEQGQRLGAGWARAILATVDGTGGGGYSRSRLVGGA